LLGEAEHMKLLDHTNFDDPTRRNVSVIDNLKSELCDKHG